MKKDDYLAKEHVKRFIAYLTRELPLFKHQYRYVGKKGDEHGSRIWTCNGFTEAANPKVTKKPDGSFSGYWWPYDCTVPAGKGFARRKGGTLEESHKVLADLARDLQSAVKNENDVNTQLACQGILGWGGVLNGNQMTVFNKADGLSNTLACIKSKLEEPQLDDKRIGTIIRNELQMNAGFTKIYSCLAKNFIMYDSRVGAALGLLVRKYHEVAQLDNDIDPSLNFPWSEGAGENKENGSASRRDPSSQRYKFQKMGTNAVARYTIWNVRANWIVETLVPQLDLTEKDGVPAHRQVEAALFMIGYDVR